MEPKGKLLLIGGTDESPDAKTNQGAGHIQVLSDLLPAALEKTIEIITTATGIRDDLQKLFLNELHKFGHPGIGFLNVANRDEANQPEFIQRIKDADAVFFSGGDQFRISSVIGGTTLASQLKEKYHNNPGFIVAGMGAGAMAIPEIMIADGGMENAPKVSDLKTNSGLGLLKNCIIDTHFIGQGRFGRLAHAVAINPMELGIGLGECSALLIENGTEATCLGTGMVIIIDGQNIRHTNVAMVKPDDPIFADHLTVHLLVKDCRFSLEKREMINANEMLEPQKTPG